MLRIDDNLINEYKTEHLECSYSDKVTIYPPSFEYESLDARAWFSFK